MKYLFQEVEKWIEEWIAGVTLHLFYSHLFYSLLRYSYFLEEFSFV